MLGAGRLWVALCCAAAALPSPVAAQSLGQALRDVAPGNAACRGAEPNAVVVCGRRADRYRIDRAVLQSSRSAERGGGRPSATAQALAEQRNAAPDRGQVNLTNLPKMPAERALMAAISGGDWREPLRQGGDDYGAYAAEKEAQSAVKK